MPLTLTNIKKRKEKVQIRDGYSFSGYGLFLIFSKCCGPPSGINKIFKKEKRYPKEKLKILQTKAQDLRRTL
ncbi:UNVERIFIED_CONTAM: hypothetical protein NCL1_08313 [Trichonephila clavipes]